ncbi:MAG: hypothetical protein U1F57_00080 [bacterium]
MSPVALDEPIRSARLEKAMERISARDFDKAEVELNAGLQEAEKSKDPVMEALFYSTLGVLYKLKKDYKGAWRFYDKAEKILPNDPALKLISARLLVDVFGQYDTAIKKAEKVLKLAQYDHPFSHQAHVTLGLAFLKKGQKKKAVDCLKKSMKDDFEGMISAGNIDLKLLEALLQKKLGEEECRTYLEKAFQFAQKTGEPKPMEQLALLLKHFPPAPTP